MRLHAELRVAVQRVKVVEATRVFVRTFFLNKKQ